MPGGGSNAGKCCFHSVFVFVFSAGFIVLIYWAIFQPHHIRATVESATLANLTVVSTTSNSTSTSNASSSAATVSYNLAVTLSLYNPSVRVNIYYDAIFAELRFRDAVVGPAANATSPPAFYQRRKTSDDVRLEFDYGTRPGGVAVGADVAAELEKEMRRGGPVSLELALDVRVRYVFRMFKLRQKPKIWCALSIPVKTEGHHRGFGSDVVAGGDWCRVKY